MRDILDLIWQPLYGYVFMPYRENGIWHEGSALNLADPILRPFTETADQYFTPLVFGRPERKNENVNAMNVLYADIDSGQTELIRPSICWETSPGSYQGVWLLTHTITPEVFNELNRDLTYYIGADRGGWHASKVLRIPGTLNWKRATNDDRGLSVPRGRILWAYGENTYTPEALREVIPAYDHIPGAVNVKLDPIPPTLGPVEWDLMLDTLRYQLPLSVVSWLLQKWCTDRSMMIWRVAGSMAMSGIPMSVAFQMIDGTSWNKWKDNPRMLWKDVNKAYSYAQVVFAKDSPPEPPIGD